MTPRSTSSPTTLVILLWSMVVLEFISPIPAFLTLGAAYVLLVHPPWFPELVRRLYGTRPGTTSSIGDIPN